MSYNHVVGDVRWVLYDSDEPLFERPISDPADSFVSGEWVSSEMFYIATLGGQVELWSVDSSVSVEISERVTLVPSRFHVSGIGETHRIESRLVASPRSVAPRIRKAPELLFSVTGNADFRSAVSVTVEGFVVTSPEDSVVTITCRQTRRSCSLATYFRSKYRGRCAIGDPVRHEARIGVNDEIYCDDFSAMIGEHRGAFRLFAPPVPGDVFMTFSSDGSIKGWDRTHELRGFYDLSEPVARITWIEERSWVVCIGCQSSFSVIDPVKMKSVLLCSGHNSPIIEVIYLNCLLHARCQSSSIYSWNIDGQLVSKRKSKRLKRVGGGAVPQSPNVPVFSKVVPLVMPNCQTFAVVLNVLEFLRVFGNCHTLPIRTDPLFKPLLFLWHLHVGDGKLDICDEVGILSRFSYAIAGDNYTVTLPISRRVQATARMGLRVSSSKHDIITAARSQGIGTVKITSHIAFEFSSLLSAVHAVAASALGQCFCEAHDDESLSLVSAICQTTTSMALAKSVRPSVFCLANWLHETNASLRFVVTNVLQEIFRSLDEDECRQILERIQERFKNWFVILPIAFLVANYCKLPAKFARECVAKLFPIILQCPVTMELLSSSFDTFLPHFKDTRNFFTVLFQQGPTHGVQEGRIVTFALRCPCDFFDVVVQTPQCFQMLELLFQRWSDPDRGILLDFLLYMTNHIPRQMAVEFEKVYATVTSRFAFVGSCRQYLAIGGEDGDVMIISKEAGGMMAKQKLFTGPVNCLSVSPNGHRILALSLQEKKLTWVLAGHRNNRVLFEVSGNEAFQGAVMPATVVWKGDSRVILQRRNGEVIQMCSAPRSFSMRFIGF
jgi:WD40 repeat protein